MKKIFLSLLIIAVCIFSSVPAFAASEGDVFAAADSVDAVENTMPLTAATHSHPLCGNRCACSSTSHSNLNWTAWDGTTRMYNGYYYLTKDVVLSNTMILNNGYSSYLCLNGHSISCEGTVFDIYSLNSLTITDCVGSGEVESTDGPCTIGNNKYLSIWGGTILNSSGDNDIVIKAYPGDTASGTTTYINGGTVENPEGYGLYTYPGSKIYVRGGIISCPKYPAITGQGLDSDGSLANLTVSGGQILTDYYDAIDLEYSNFTMTGGYVGGDVTSYAPEGVISVSGGTIDGMLSVDARTLTVTGGTMALNSYAEETTISAGTFVGDPYTYACTFSGDDTVISGGNFLDCDYIYVNDTTWICGGYFDDIIVGNASVYLSGVPEIASMEIGYANKVSAQNPDGSGSYGGDPIEILPYNRYSSTSLSTGSIVIKNVTSDAVAARFVLSDEASQWQRLERSDTNLVLREIPHGTCGTNANWVLENGVLTIYGTGEIAYKSNGRAYPWGSYLDRITAIIVEDGITSIPAYTFEHCENAATISLPETLTSLNLNAFQDCGSLNNLMLPSSLQTIGGTSNTLHPAFIRCESLTDLYYLGTEEEWKLVENSRYVTSCDSDMTIHLLELCEGTATCTRAGIPDYYQFDDASGLYDLDKNPISSLSVVPALGHRAKVKQTVEGDPIKLENNSVVPFVLTNGVYYSNNKAHGSSSELRITALCDCRLTLKYGVSSENNYDNLFISHNGTQKVMISGEVANQTITLDLKANEVVTVRYVKDGSYSSGSDRGWVSLEYDKVTSFVETEVPADKVEADCRGDVVCYYCQTVIKEAKAHTWNNGVVFEPTCTESGGVTFTCLVCGSSRVEDEKPALGHTTVTDPAQAPTCTESGLTEGSHCSVCGEVFAAQQPVPALGHTYGNAVFVWTDVMTAAASAQCQCGHGEEASCTMKWDPSVKGRLTVAAEVQFGESVFRDSKEITSVNVDGAVIITLPNEIPGLYVLSAVYDSRGRMIRCEASAVSGREIRVTVSGEDVRIFFLQNGYRPLFPTMFL